MTRRADGTVAVVTPRPFGVNAVRNDANVSGTGLLIESREVARVNGGARERASPNTKEMWRLHDPSFSGVSFMLEIAGLQRRHGVARQRGSERARTQGK